MVYVATGTLDLAASGSLTNTATVSVPAGLADTNLGNNSATDTDSIPFFLDGFESGDTSSWSATVP